ALPAERIPDAVDEIEIPLLILAQQIAGAEPDVVLFEDVVQDLLLGFRARRIALEAGGRPRGIVEDFSDSLAGLVRRAFYAEALLVAHRLLILDVELDDLGREAMRHEPRDAADRAGLALEIEGRHVAFGRGIELENPRDVEATDEFRPHV